MNTLSLAGFQCDGGLPPYYYLKLILHAALPVLFLHLTPAIAFDSNEHCSLSNLAAQIAFDHILTDSPLTTAQRVEIEETQRLLLADSDNTADPSQLSVSNNYCFPTHHWAHRSTDKSNPYIPNSYGKIVALVDFTINPVDLFDTVGSGHVSPSNWWQFNETYFRSTFNLGSKLDLAYHNNSDHFQGNALILFNSWHTKALQVAEEPREARLFAALANEALADHFLEDTFAPGHIITPREGMSDAVALSWHDAFNARGRVVGIRNWDALLSIFNFVYQRQSQYDIAFRRIGNALIASGDYSSRTSLKESLQTLTSVRVTSCRDDLRGIERFFSYVLDPRKDTYAAALDFRQELLAVDSKIATESPLRTVCLHGDGALDEHNHRIKKYIGAQKALMILVEARYIEDVFNAYINPAPRAPENFTWCPTIRAEWLRARGSWKNECANLLVKAESICGSCKSVVLMPSVKAQYIAYLSSPMSSDTLNGGTADYRDFLYAAHIGTTSANQRVVGKIGLEIGFGVMDEDTERLSTIDTQADDPFSTKCFLSFFRHSCQVETQVWGGYEYNMGNTTRLSDALTVRAALQIPNRSFQLGPYYDYDRVGNGVDRRYRGGFGMRADLGFSVLSFYIASGVEPRLYEPIRTARGFAISAGVSISANGRRLWTFLSGRSGY